MCYSKDSVLFSAQRPITKLLKLVRSASLSTLASWTKAHVVSIYIYVTRTHVTHMENRETMGIVDPKSELPE